MIDRLKNFHKTSLGLLVFGLGELTGGVLFVFWALDSGSLIDWFLAIVLAVGGLQNIVRAVRKGFSHAN